MTSHVHSRPGSPSSLEPSEVADLQHVRWVHIGNDAVHIIWYLFGPFLKMPIYASFSSPTSHPPSTTYYTSLFPHLSPLLHTTYLSTTTTTSTVTITYVLRIRSEHWEDYQVDQLSTQFGEVSIVIYPLKNTMYRVQIITKLELPEFGPLFRFVMVIRGTTRVSYYYSQDCFHIFLVFFYAVSIHNIATKITK